MTENTDKTIAVIDRLARFYFVARTYGNALHAHRSITTGDRAVMMEIAQKGERTVVQMAEHRGISKQAIQKTVDRLARRALVEKIIPPTDRRNRIIRLTLAGRSMLQDMFVDEMSVLTDMVRQLDPADVAAVNRLLDEIEPTMIQQSAALSKDQS